MLATRPHHRPSPARDLLLGQYATRGLTLSFDVRRVSSAGHWKVNVLKLADDQDERASVDFVARLITLYYNDTKPSPAINDAGKISPKFMTLPHEFGHTLDVDDEYEKGSSYLPDRSSMMNIGSQLRPRHLRLLAATLEKMVPGCGFTPRV
jgi:hypothetical protein